jgi:hypothetical protein
MNRPGWTSACTIALAAATGASAAHANAVNFNLLRSNGLPAGCAANASATVKVRAQPGADNFAEKMTVSVSGLAAHAELDIFVIQVPNTPFGPSWYLGDLATDGAGKITHTFVSRFNLETFAVGPDVAPAPAQDGVKDANQNPTFKPLHTYHVGIWFNSPAHAHNNGATCPATVTPFNGGHTAGVQVLSSRNAANTNNLSGPLRIVHD